VTGIFLLSYRCGFNLIPGLDYSNLPEEGVFIRFPPPMAYRLHTKAEEALASLLERYSYSTILPWIVPRTETLPPAAT
jgi:hypothetical protein